jgi:hypothetical protein
MSIQREQLGAFPAVGPLPYLDLPEGELRAAAESGPYPAETTWFHATYPDRLPLILRTGLIPSCWWGGDSCAVFGVAAHDGVGVMRQDDPLIEVRSCALPDSPKAWWVPPFAIRGVWLHGKRQPVSPDLFRISIAWPRAPDGCGCELTEMVREEQELWRRTWSPPPERA